MTKKEAKAILACQERITRALNSCLNQLGSQEKEYAEAYWAAHIRSTITGSCYGGAPIIRAMDKAAGDSQR